MNMRAKAGLAGGVLLALACATSAEPVVYPAKGQSAAQQQRDDGECYGWARGNTGIDPAAVAAQPAPASGPAVGGGERVRGAARGALGGAAIGAIAGNTGKGAAIGAVSGTMVGGHRARQSQTAQQQGAQQAKQDQINTFYRAYGACMEGRGYTVK